jgi:hypothetical protein
MHSIAAGQNFNVPLGGITLHFCKLLPIGFAPFQPLLKGLMAEA